MAVHYNNKIPDSVTRQTLRDILRNDKKLEEGKSIKSEKNIIKMICKKAK